jgi:1-phosphofructokinase family hexose kinase
MSHIYTLTLNPGVDRTLTVPTLQENSVLRATSSRLDWGGKGFNVSRALQALGEESIALGIVGGFTGQMLSEGLRGLGITTDFVHIASETRTNTVIKETNSGRYFKVNEAGPTIEVETLEALRARIAAYDVQGSYWALCGSLPPGVPANFYAELITDIQGRGGMVCLDASGEALWQGIAASPFLVKPNREEASEITGIPIDDRQTAQRAADVFLTQGVQWVALSVGADGMLLFRGTESVFVRAPEVAVQTVVGVGDALLAGVLYALRRDLSMFDIARWGVAAGTAAAMTPGVGVGSFAEVSALFDQLGPHP